MAWKCKRCGEENIVKYISGRFNGKETRFNKNENSLSTENLDLDVLSSSEYICDSCGAFEFKIEDIATWED